MARRPSRTATPAAPAIARPSVGWLQGSAVGMIDGLQNLMTGMGTESDKTFQTHFGFGFMDRSQLDAAYRGDWIARKGIDIPAFDTFREWRTWQADPDDVSKIEDLEKKLCLQIKLMRAFTYGRLYGGGALILGVNQGNPEDELDPESIGEDDLEFVHVLSRWELATGPRIWDITSPYYGRPEWYAPAQNQITQSAATKTNATLAKLQSIRLHPSRVVTFTGNHIPDVNQAVDGWGDSVLQQATDAIIGAGTTVSAVSQLVVEAKIDVINIPGLSENIINEEYETRLKKRFQFASMAKGVYKTLLLDKEETWNRINSQFAGLPDVLKLYLMVGSSAFDIPSTRFLSQSPQGLNATGDSDTRNYYDRISTEQKVFVSPTMDTLDRVLVRSAIGTVTDDEFKDMFYDWNPLWQLSETERGTNSKTKAEAWQIDVTAGLMNEVVLKKAREAQLIADGTYPGLAQILEEYDDDPELEQANAEAEALAAQMGAGAPPITDPNDPNYDPTKDPNSPQFAGPAKPAAPPPATAPPKRGAANVKSQPPTKTQPPPTARSKASAQQRAADAIVRRLADASTPRSLYVRRDVLNSADIVRWAKSQGFKSVVPGMHVTIIYSKQPVDWLKAGADDFGSDQDGNLTVRPGGPRVLERFGSAVVLGFANSDLSYRHRSMMNRCEDDGISWDWEDYTPHVTITYDAGAIDLENVEPYTGEIRLGPEIFEEIKGFDPAQLEEKVL